MADQQTVKRRVRSASKQAVYYRNYRRARDRALVRLAQANPAQYQVFLQEERERDLAEGKAWASLSGDTHHDSDHVSDDVAAVSDPAEGGAGDSGSQRGANPANEPVVG